MANVTINFAGKNDEEAAQKFYTWIIDGGLSDGILDECSGDEYILDLSSWDNSDRSMTFTSSPKKSK